MASPPPANLLINGSYWNDKVYLNTAAEGLPLQSCARGVQTYLEAKSRGEPGREILWQEYHRAKAGAARLFHVEADQIALVSSTTEALNTIAQAIDWKPGDEVVFTSAEFPSNIFPWVALERRGVRTRIVHPGKDGVSMEQLLAEINPRTRLVTLSQVSYATGEHLDPLPVWQRVQDTPTLLCVDATQAAARVPVRGDQADFTIASAFKWMNSIHGAAAVAVSRRILDDNLHGPAGWLSAESCFAEDRLEAFHPRADAQRFQAGMPNFDSVCALAEALEFHTPARVGQQHDQQRRLVSWLREELLELGLDVLLPEDPARHAGIVSFRCDASAAWKETLARQGIFVQGDDRRVRAALHWHTEEQHVERYLAAIRPLAQGEAGVVGTHDRNSG